MAEYLAVSAQEVAVNGNVVFTNMAVQGNNCIKHREGSGIVTLRGITNQCRARYFVDFQQISQYRPEEQQEQSHSQLQSAESQFYLLR